MTSISYGVESNKTLLNLRTLDTLRTVSGGVTCHPVLRQVRFYPEPASAISTRDISDIELTLSWKAPQGDWNSFELKYLDYNNLLVEASTKQTFITIHELKTAPELFLHYLHKISTREAVPEKVPTSRPVAIQPSQIRWTLPIPDQNAVLIGLTISYAATKLGKKDVPEVLAKTTTSIKLHQLQMGLFSDENGQVIGYTIIASVKDENKVRLIRKPAYCCGGTSTVGKRSKLQRCCRLISSWSNTIYFEIPLPKYSLLVVKPARVASNLPVIVTDSLKRELHTNSKYVPLPQRYFVQRPINIPKLVLLQDPDNSTAIVGVIISAVILLLCGATTALS
uniref:Fibronectin type-III domain-containing protein n=1 Tax=Daphnia galeata TaxID=27404 RepID=A0A8J2WUR4_9CRUS|nr:unnamed protein product [Daphnia galeata]